MERIIARSSKHRFVVYEKRTDDSGDFYVAVSKAIPREPAIQTAEGLSTKWLRGPTANIARRHV